MHSKVSYDLQEKQSSFPPNDRWGCHLRAICNTMDTHNIVICPIERYGYALKSVRDISRICEEEMRESNHMRDITHLYPIYTLRLLANQKQESAPSMGYG